MSDGLRGVRLAAGLFALALGTALLGGCYKTPNVATQPKLLLLTGLPLMFGEDFTIENSARPVIDELRRTHEVVAISNTSPAELKKGRLLVMAQPRAQPAENLVALDEWVRGGGRLLLFADPRLEWHSDLPLGDFNRPPPMFADTGLLAHWGLRLDAPDAAGAVTVEGPEGPESYLSPGRLVKTGGTCTLSRDGIVADCPIGKGRALVVADADLLDDEAADPRAPSSAPAPRLLNLLASLTRQ